MENCEPLPQNSIESQYINGIKPLIVDADVLKQTLKIKWLRFLAIFGFDGLFNPTIIIMVGVLATLITGASCIYGYPHTGVVWDSYQIHAVMNYVLGGICGISVLVCCVMFDDYDNKWLYVVILANVLMFIFAVIDIFKMQNGSYVPLPTPLLPEYGWIAAGFCVCLVGAVNILSYIPLVMDMRITKRIRFCASNCNIPNIPDTKNIDKSLFQHMAITRYIPIPTHIIHKLNTIVTSQTCDTLICIHYIQHNENVISDIAVTTGRQYSDEYALVGFIKIKRSFFGNPLKTQLSNDDKVNIARQLLKNANDPSDETD